MRINAKNCFYPVIVKNKRIIGFGNVTSNNIHPKQIESIDKKTYIYPIDKNGIERKWRYARQSVEGVKHLLRFNNNDIQIGKDFGRYRTVWQDSRYDSNEYGTKLIKKILPNCEFEYPKSLYTVYDCIYAVVRNRPRGTVLDYFAGSGTTAHSVLELNKEDGGNRKFILCTNNELNGEENKLKEKGLLEEEIQSHGICQAVTYPRIKKVITGYEKRNGEKVEGLGGNLKYFKTSFVPADPTDKNKIALTEKATVMLCIKEDTFEEVKSTKQYRIFRNKKRYTGIVFDHQAIDDFKKEMTKIDGKFSLYIFSLGDDTFDEGFEDLKKKVKLSPIPEAILKVYREIFKPNRK